MPYLGADDPQLVEDLRAALRMWHRPGLDRTRLGRRLAAVERRRSAGSTLSGGALRDTLLAALGRLSAAGHAEQARLLEQHYMQQRPATSLAYARHLSERTLYYHLGQALIVLAQAVWLEEVGARSTPSLPASVGPPATDGRLTRHLPPSTTSRLFGADSLLHQLLDYLTDPADHWLICLEGLGGLGKTAIAREAIVRLAEAMPERFCRVSWLTAGRPAMMPAGWEWRRQPAMAVDALLDALAAQLDDETEDRAPAARGTRLRALLKAQPCLVVLDNLEGVEDWGALAGELWALGNPTKFLLTSRRRVDDGVLPICHVPLAPLSESDALAMIRYEGELRGLGELSAADDDTLRAILVAVDGHPLAIKLVAGRLASLPLAQVLASLRDAQRDAGPLYEFLYAPTWDLLTESARSVLIHLALLPVSGGRWDDLTDLCRLTDAGLSAAVTELAAHSLLQIAGVGDKVYSLHPLTRHFSARQAARQGMLSGYALRVANHFARLATDASRAGEGGWRELTGRQEHYSLALQLGAGLGREGAAAAVEIGRRLGPALIRQGKTAAWLPCLELAVAAARELGDEAGEAELSNQGGMIATSRGELDAALAQHRRALAIYRRRGDTREIAQTLRLEGNVHYTRPDRPAALACYEQARELLLSLDEPSELSHVTHNIANIHGAEGRWEAALRAYEQALALLDPRRDRGAMATLLCNTGLLRWEMGHCRQAIDDLSRALPMQQLTGDRIGEANAHHYLALAYADLEDWGRAVAHGCQAQGLRGETGSAEGMADVNTDLASIYLRRGDLAEAERCAAQAGPLWQAAGRPQGLGRLRRVEAELAGRLGDQAAALVAGEQALSLLPASTAAWERLLAILEVAQARIQAGDRPGALAALPEAQTLATAAGRPEGQVRVLWLAAALDPPAAPGLLAQALAASHDPGGLNDRLARLRRETHARLERARIGAPPGGR